MNICHCCDQKYLFLLTFPSAPIHGCGQGVAKQLSTWLDDGVMNTVHDMVIKPNTVTFVKTKQ